MLKLRVNGKPAFADEGQEYACNFCPVRLSSETDLLEHWRWEMEKEGWPETICVDSVLEEVVDDEDGEVEQKKCESLAIPKMYLKPETEERPQEEVEGGCKRQRDHLSTEDDLESELHHSFVCDKCHYTCIKWDTMNAHKNRKHKWADANLVFFCDYCEYSCKVRDTLNAHIRRRHKGYPIRNKYRRMETLIENPDPKNDMFSCDQCVYSCNVRDTLNAHKRRKHKQKTKKDMDDTEDQQGALLPPDLDLNPEENHSNEEGFDASDALLSNLGQFKKTKFVEIAGQPKKRKDKGPKDCDECDYTCDKQNTLLKHKARNHKSDNCNEMGPNTVRCSECPYNCNNEYTLRIHKQRRHKGSEADVDELSHKHKQTENKTLFCDQCDYSCSKKDTLNAHKNRKHREADQNQMFECDQCDYSCNRRDTLNAHRSRKHREGHLDVTYSCELCEYSCSVRDTLNAHVRRKHKVKG